MPLKKLCISGLCCVIAAALAACGPAPVSSPSGAPSSQAVSPVESGGEGTGNAAVTPEVPSAVTIPTSYGGEGWEAQAIGWIDNTRLIAVFGPEETRNGPDVTEKAVVVYNMADKTERLACAFSDGGWVGDIRANADEVLITSSEQLYLLPQADLAQITALPYKGDDWHGNTFGGLYTGRDAQGIVIRSGDGKAIRVATKTEAYFFDVPQWSPDGRYLLYNKYFGGVGHPVNKCVADRAGRPVCEFAFPQTDQNTYWSNDSRYIVAKVLDHPDGLLRLLDVEAGQEIAARPSPYVEQFRSILDAHKSTTVWWRQAGNRQPCTVYTFDILTGQAVDIATLPRFCDAKFSPDGRTLAVLERKSAAGVYFFESGLE